MSRDISIQQYLDDAVSFRPDNGKPLRVGATLLTCRVAVAVLNELRLPEESGPAYRYINTHNPRCPLVFNREAGLWCCSSVLEDHPVWSVNWAAARLICQHLGGRLPLAGEWECFASNNDPTRAYPWGDDAPSCLLANYNEHYGGTSPVASFPPSDAGLYDLAGNLFEWCADAYEESPLEKTVKGGAWSKDEHHLAIKAARGKWARLGTTTIGVRPIWDDAVCE